MATFSRVGSNGWRQGDDGTTVARAASIGWEQIQSAGTGAVSVTTGVGALTLTGYAPSIIAPVSVTTGVGALVVTGYAPAVTTQTAVTTGVGALAVTGYAPTVRTNTAVSTGVGALAVTGYAPTLTEQQKVDVGVGALAVAGYEPSVQVVEAGAVAVPAASLTITGQAPTVTEQISLTTGVGELSITGYAPSVSTTANVSVTTSVAALEIAGYAPTASILLNVLPGAAEIVLTGYAPDIIGGMATIVAKGEQPAGRPSKSRKPSTRRRKPILINVDGEEFVVNSEAEALELIEKARDVAESNARAQANTILEKRKAKAARDGKLNTTPLRLDEPSVTVTPAQDGYIDRAWVAEVDNLINESIRQAYETAARDAETQLLLAQRMMLDEEDTLVALLLTI